MSAMPPSETDFIIRHGGQEFRAPDVATLKAWAAEGRIVRDSEVFHPVLKVWTIASNLAELRSVYPDISSLARNYRQLVLWFGVQFLVGVIPVVALRTLRYVVPIAAVITITALAFYAYRTAAALRESTPLLWAIAMFVPCANGITLLILSAKSTRVCRANGVAVGLLGPRA
jgi:hypothetical protein